MAGIARLRFPKPRKRMPGAASFFSSRDGCDIGIVTYGGVRDGILLLGRNEDADGRDLEAVQGN